ncbi:MAG: asparagine synthase-related protein [Blastocatellia bacterium]
MKSARLLLNHLTKPTVAPVTGWMLAFGPAAAPENFAWRDEECALMNAQPSFSPQQRFAVIGDVWLSNRAQLLREAGLLPETDDAGIIAVLWERHGHSALPLLQGMFAFAVWDQQQRELWLARDAVGARTIYYTTTGATRFVAPKLQTLARRLSPETDLVALRDYLCCAFVPGERTMWRGISELRPGTLLRLPADEKQIYWQVREQLAENTEPLAWHAQQLRAELEEVISEYLPGNAPVGAYLSGGLDSSCVVALAARLHAHPVHTYSIHFGDETPNELEFSGLVAAHCRTTHHIIAISTEQMWSLLPETMAALDDPIGDPLTIPNLILGRAAKQNVDVILNGEGGDPCFGGPKNQPMLLDSLYRPTTEAASARNPVAAYLDSFQKCSPDLPRLLKAEVWRAIKDEPSVFAPELAGAGSFLNRLMFINTKFKGADHILTKVNNLTQYVGLQGRSPLFDRRVVALSLTIPPEYKLSGAEEKAVLKAAVRDLLPERILARPKSGMMVPVQLWFRKYWQRQARALLLGRRAQIRELLNQELIRDWLDYRGDTWGRYGVKLWLLVSLELWLQAQRRR